MSELALPDGWRTMTVGAAATPQRVFAEGAAKLRPYVGLEQVEAHSGRILGHDDNVSAEANAFAFDERHVLYSKLRPYLNKVALPEFSGRCSTEAIPLLPGKDLDRRYLAAFLRKQETVGAVMKSKTGSRMPRADMSALLALSLPLPPLDEQRRITDQLDAAMAEIAVALAALERQRSLAAKLFDARRDELLDGAEGKLVTIGDVCDLDGPLVDPRRPEWRGLACVSAEHIQATTGRLLSVPTAAQQKMISGKYRFEAGAVLYSKLRPYLRKVAIAPFDGLCSADMYPLRARLIIRQDYLQTVLLSSDFTEYAFELSRRARMPKLNREQLASYSFELPSLSEQESLSGDLMGFAADLTKAQNSLDKEAAALDALGPSLLSAAFRGNL